MKKILLVLVVLLAVAPLGATAQEDNASDVANASAPESVVQVDKLTVVSDYEIRDGNLWIQFRSDGGNTLSITETAQDGGATQVRVRTVDIPRGVSSVTIDLFRSSEASVLITSRLSLQQNSGTTISVDSAEPLIAGPFTASDAQAAGLGGALSVSMFTLFLVLRAARGESDGVERIA